MNQPNIVPSSPSSNGHSQHTTTNKPKSRQSIASNSIDWSADLAKDSFF
jgi:hypothetical protein